MSAPPQRHWTREDYDRDAREYLASLPLEHFMEATPQSTQREIFVSSFAVLRARWPDVRYYSELLLQTIEDGVIIRVVPDNMVVLGPLDNEPRSSYAVELETYPVFWTLEYVSESNRRKDYVDSFEKYEMHFKVPYYLIFDPEHQDLRLYHLHGKRHVPVEANEAGRYPIPPMELEVGLLDGWMRIWYRGELLPLPAELQRQMNKLAQELEKSQEELHKSQEELHKSQEELHKSQEELRRRDAEFERGQEELRRRSAEIQRRDEEARRRDIELLRTQEELQRRDVEIQRRDEEARQRDEEMQHRREELRQRDEEVRKRQQREEAMASMLRPLVEARARQAGRQDILEQLPGMDGQQLTQWLAELG